MKKIIWWVVGVVAALLVIAAIVCVGAMVMRSNHGMAWTRDQIPEQRWDDRRLEPGEGMHFRPRGGFIARPYGMFAFPGWLGGLVCLGILGVLGAGALVLVYRAGGRKRPVPVQAVAEAPVASTPVAHPCGNCQRPVQEDWVHCPYCGSDLKPEAEKTDTP
jgi:hypothetical protein